MFLKNVRFVCRGSPSSLLLQAQRPRRYFLTDHRPANRPVVKAADEKLTEAVKIDLKPEQDRPKFVPPTRQKIALKWKLLAFVAGFGVSTYLIEKYYLRPNYEIYVRLYKTLPLRAISRAWGEVNSIELPVWARKPVYRLYSWSFDCKLHEAEIEDLSHYKNLGEFFRRALKPEVRVINHQCCLSSPCDGKILYFGPVEDGHLEQIKGVTYPVDAFLGKQNWPKAAVQSTTKQSSTDYEKNVLYNPADNRLYSCIIYLAPGDYHRFHSPVDWTVFSRRHFPGELFSVSPSVASWLKGLFNVNERVVYYGQWRHGFFAMSAVGATNVGSIRIYMDQDLKTNALELEDKEEKLDKLFCSPKNSKLSGGKVLKRGDPFGEFNLGSTIVLVFEAPKDFKFTVRPSDKILYGQELGSSSSACKKA